MAPPAAPPVLPPAQPNPCNRRCDQKLSCAALNVSFTCDAITSLLGCDCTGCCLAALNPSPPTLPPSLPPPPSSPSPLLPPLAPGGLWASSTTELQAVVDELNRQIKAMLARDDVRKNIAGMGARADYGTPQQFSDFVDAETRKFAAIIEKEGLQMEVK